MEDEWKSMRMYFTSCVSRFLLSKKYLFYLLTTLLCAIFSINFLDAVYQTTKFMPSEVFESFKAGEVYNLGVLTVRDLDCSQMQYYDEILMGILSGSFMHCILALSISSFICSEFKNGYIEIAIVHGQRRIALFNQYIVCSVIMIIPLVLVVIFGTSFSLILNGMFSFKSAFVIVKTIAIQFVMLSALCVCVASCSIIIQGFKAVILCMSGIIILPLISNYINVFTKGEIDLSCIMLLNQLINSSSVDENNGLKMLLISIITGLAFYVVCMQGFRIRNFK